MQRTIADIFSNMDAAKRNRLMAGLDAEDHEAALQIRDLKFTFEDLARIDAQGIQVLIRRVDPQTLALALKTAPESILRLFLENMSQRAVLILKEDIQSLSAVRASDVEHAQNEIAATAQQLGRDGVIVIPGVREKYLR
ncbi:MAG: hypothetical protein HUJ11_05145 [Arenibacter algicola]|nr:hypothetical protein [Arenibacter algicola]